jgi:hypothetical protein
LIVIVVNHHPQRTNAIFWIVESDVSKLEKAPSTPLTQQKAESHELSWLATAAQFLSWFAAWCHSDSQEESRSKCTQPSYLGIHLQHDASVHLFSGMLLKYVPTVPRVDMLQRRIVLHGMARPNQLYVPWC